jgi:hypothetical protein
MLGQWAGGGLPLPQARPVVARWVLANPAGSLHPERICWHSFLGMLLLHSHAGKVVPKAIDYC